MPACEFSERQFEFCANFQLQARLGGYLVGGRPTIPSQVAEALAGYDAAYHFVGGRSLFIQYKVPHFSPKPHGRGAATYKLWGRPYFRCGLHEDPFGGCTQHNTLIGLTSQSAESLYVSPCFVTNSGLASKFAGGAGSGVVGSSLLAPLSALPTIHDGKHHSFSYPQDASAFRIHSEASREYPAERSLAAVLARLEPQPWGEKYFLDLRAQLHGALLSHDVRPVEPPEGTQFSGPVAEIAANLEQRLNAVMILVPNEEDESEAAGT